MKICEEKSKWRREIMRSMKNEIQENNYFTIRLSRFKHMAHALLKFKQYYIHVLRTKRHDKAI